MKSTVKAKQQEMLFERFINVKNKVNDLVKLLNSIELLNENLQLMDNDTPIICTENLSGYGSKWYRTQIQLNDKVLLVCNCNNNRRLFLESVENCDNTLNIFDVVQLYYPQCSHGTEFEQLRNEVINSLFNYSDCYKSIKEFNEAVNKLIGNP